MWPRPLNRGLIYHSFLQLSRDFEHWTLNGGSTVDSFVHKNCPVQILSAYFLFEIILTFYLTYSLNVTLNLSNDTDGFVKTEFRIII